MPISIFVERHHFDVEENGLFLSEECEKNLVQRGYSQTHQDYDGVNRFRYYRKSKHQAETIVVKLAF